MLKWSLILDVPQAESEKTMHIRLRFQVSAEGFFMIGQSHASLDTAFNNISVHAKTSQTFYKALA